MNGWMESFWRSGANIRSQRLPNEKMMQNIFVDVDVVAAAAVAFSWPPEVVKKI